MSEGMRNSLRFKKETTFGVAPTGDYTLVRKTGDAGVGLSRAQIKTEEMNARRAVTGFRLGAKMPKVTVPFELSYSAFDTFMECAMMSDWVAAGTASSGLTGVVVAGTTNTIGATGIGTGLAAGDWIKISGFASPMAGNNGFHKVTVATANLITLGESKDAAGNSLLTAGTSAGATVIVQKMGYLVGGTTVESVAFEEAQEDIPLFFRTLGNMCDSFDLSFQPDQIVKGTFNFLGKTYATPQGTPFSSATPIAAPTNEPIQANESRSYLSLDGVPVAVVTSLDLSLKNSLAQYLAVAGQDVAKIGRGDSDLTGTLSVFYDSDAYWTKYLNETALSLTVKFVDLTGNQGYAFDIPRIKITESTLNRSKDNTLQSLPFQALETTDKSVLNMKIWRLV